MGVEKSSREGPSRVLSIDQFRGYAIAGMMLVNFLGEFSNITYQFKHHRTSMSYADTIAPVFIFVVGMGFRLSFMRRSASKGPWRARWDAAKRYIVLFIIGAVFYGGTWQKDWWDALTDIGIAGLLAIPFIDKAGWVRFLAACGYLALYQVLFSFCGYGEWTMAHSIDGGPLGPLSWVFILLIGTLAYDAMVLDNPKRTYTRLLAWGLGLSVAGWVLRAEWPGVKEFWYFSQRAMSSPYPVYSTGLAFLTLLLFCIVCDRWKFEIPTFTVLGINPLVLYLVHNVIIDSNKNSINFDCPIWQAVAIFAVFYLFCYAVARRLYNEHIVIKI